MIKISHKLLLGDFGGFDDAMQKEVTGSEFFVWVLFFLLYFASYDNNAESVDSFY